MYQFYENIFLQKCNLKCLRNDIAKFYSLTYKSRDSVHSGRFSKSQTGIRCNFRAEHAGD